MNRRDNNEQETAGAVEASQAGELVPVREAQRLLAEQLLEQSRETGVELVGPDGLLTQLTRQVLESALDVEMTEHLGYDRGAARQGDNARNGHSTKRVLTEVGPVEIRVPRDRAGEFEPQIVEKHQRRLDGFDAEIVSLYAKGLTTGEIRSHLAEVYGSEVSRELISKVTDRVVDDMRAWRNRPLDEVWPVVFIDALYVKIRDGQVQNRPIYVALGVNLDGERDVLGLWVGDGGEGAKHWAGILSELNNRGIRDVWMLCCDGLKGLPDAVTSVFPRTIVQTCVVHLVRATLRYASRSHWQTITRQLRGIYTAPTREEAESRRDEFLEQWSDRYPAIAQLWNNAWEDFVPFLVYPPELRRLVYTTNSIESLNARFRRATRVRGHFPNEQAALKVLYLTVVRRDPRGGNAIGRVSKWKQALNQLAVYFPDRMP